MSLRGAIAALRERVSLAGRLLAIIAALLMVDFVANSLLFERTNTFAVNNEEAARMAEHLVVARRLAASVPPERRHEVARQLSTERFEIVWRASRRADDKPLRLSALRDQILAAEPELAGARLRLNLQPLAKRGIGGSVLLPDGSALTFRTASSFTWSLNAGLLLRFSLPSLFLLGLGWWLVRGSFRPLHALVRATRQVGTDDLDPLPLTGPSEVRQLIAAFHRMHERIQQLLASRTQILFAIGHDLRTPLARLQLRLDGAGIDEETRTEMAGDIAEMSELLQSLQIFVETGQDHGRAERFDLAALVQNQVDEACDRGGDARYAGPASLVILGHPLGLRRAVSNLVQNALRYAGNAEVTLSRAATGIELTVSDRGPGIAPEHLAAVLQPFTRLDEARGRTTAGMGLGLAIVDRAVRAEGGELVLANRPGGGLAATIVLPEAAREAAGGTIAGPGNTS